MRVPSTDGVELELHDLGGDGPPLQAVFVPTPFSQLVPLLASGTGDIAAGGLTITPTRRAEVDFTVPYITGVEEIAVGHRGGPAPASLEDLAGLEVMLASGTSYVEHVREVSRMLEAEGLAPIGVIEAPPAMMSENVLEMVAAGIVDLTVVDEHIARLWAGVLDELVLFDEVAVNKGGEIAWALRPDLSSDLRDLLDLFMADVRKGTLIGNILFKRYYEDVTWLANPLDESGLEALATLRPYFEAAAAKHDFDWRLLAALAFQESRFDPKTKSRAGALGIMQLMPATAAELGFSDVRAPEANIEAGAAYLAKMRDLYAGEEGLAPEQQLNFALAAYNAGPTRVAALRELAADLGYDPDRWFFNVERAAAREVGLEPVRYVANINSYLLAYELGDTLLAARTEERLSVQ